MRLWCAIKAVFQHKRTLTCLCAEPLPEGHRGGRRGGGERSRCKVPPTPTRRIKVMQTSGTEKSSSGQNVRALRLYQGVHTLRQTHGGQNVTMLKKLKHKRMHTHTHSQGQIYIYSISNLSLTYRSESHVSVVIRTNVHRLVSLDTLHVGVIVKDFSSIDSNPPTGCKTVLHRETDSLWGCSRFLPWELPCSVMK